jgi:hypothetical protein
VRTRRRGVLARIAIFGAGSLTAAIACLLAVVAWIKLFNDNTVPKSVARLMAGYDTVYAPGYSEQGFDAVDVGMSREEVLAIVGPPISVSAVSESFVVQEWQDAAAAPDRPVEGIDGWIYEYAAPGPRNDSHYIRRIVLQGDMTVRSKLESFYFD